MLRPLWKAVWRLLKKLKIGVSYDPEKDYVCAHGCMKCVDTGCVCEMEPVCPHTCEAVRSVEHSGSSPAAQRPGQRGPRHPGRKVKHRAARSLASVPRPGDHTQDPGFATAPC